MMEDNVRCNSFKAWFLATRPKTLTAAMVPVALACAMAYAYGSFRWFPALTSAVFAGLMQIASNLINDLYDFLKGADREDRLGPKRATAQGWITPRAMRMGIVLVVLLACATGCLLVSQAGWWLVAVGAACVLFAFLYTLVLSYWGFGDLLVLVFFGLVPVVATFYLQTSFVCLPVVISAVACGLVIDTLLVLNNYRDREADAISGKHTVVVLFGEMFGKWLYLLLGFVACALASSLFVFGRYAAAFMPLLYLLPHLQTWRMMVRINKGRELNSVLGQTSRNIAFFGILFAIGWLLG